MVKYDAMRLMINLCGVFGVVVGDRYNVDDGTRGGWSLIIGQWIIKSTKTAPSRQWEGAP
jgi:hypothetical protein